MNSIPQMLSDPRNIAFWPSVSLIIKSTDKRTLITLFFLNKAWSSVPELLNLIDLGNKRIQDLSRLLAIPNPPNVDLCCTEISIIEVGQKYLNEGVPQFKISFKAHILLPQEFVHAFYDCQNGSTRLDRNTAVKRLADQVVQTGNEEIINLFTDLARQNQQDEIVQFCYVRYLLGKKEFDAAELFAMNLPDGPTKANLVGEIYDARERPSKPSPTTSATTTTTTPTTESKTSSTKSIEKLIEDAGSKSGVDRDQSLVEICNRLINEDRLTDSHFYAQEIKDPLIQSRQLCESVTAFCADNQVKKGKTIAAGISDPYFKFDALLSCYEKEGIDDKIFEYLMILASKIPPGEHKDFAYKDLLRVAKQQNKTEWYEKITSIIEDSDSDIDEETISDEAPKAAQDCDQAIKMAQERNQAIKAAQDRDRAIKAFEMGNGEILWDYCKDLPESDLKLLLFGGAYELQKLGQLENAIQTIISIPHPAIVESVLPYVWDLGSDANLNEAEFDALLEQASNTKEGVFEENALYAKVCRTCIFQMRIKDAFDYSNEISHIELQSVIRKDICGMLLLMGQHSLARQFVSHIQHSGIRKKAEKELFGGFSPFAPQFPPKYTVTHLDNGMTVHTLNYTQQPTGGSVQFTPFIATPKGVQIPTAAIAKVQRKHPILSTVEALKERKLRMEVDKALTTLEQSKKGENPDDSSVQEQKRREQSAQNILTLRKALMDKAKKAGEKEENNLLVSYAWEAKNNKWDEEFDFIISLINDVSVLEQFF